MSSARRQRQQYGKNQRKRSPCAACDSAGWHEPRFMCDRQCRKGGFRFYDIAAIMLEEDGKPHTMSLCRDCYNLRQAERKEPVVSCQRWRIMIGEKSSRSKLSACLEAEGFEHKMW